ncbi:MAG TPA: chromate transporter [Burkholderiaceae bacterium]|nr:chromate transporter [Burkholderiaceae bacterium]
MMPIAVNWWDLFTHFASLSLLAVGGAITTAPDMHRFLVDERGWLSDAQFTSSIALSQAAPGPNVLFIALMGWQLGINAAGGTSAGAAAWWTGLLGVTVCMVATLLPSSVLTYSATRWAHRNQHKRSVRAFKQGMAPVVIALLLATGWLLAAPAVPAGSRTQFEIPALLDPFLWSTWLTLQPLTAWLLTIVATIVVWRTRLHMLWLLGIGAALGVVGWV